MKHLRLFLFSASCLTFLTACATIHAQTPVTKVTGAQLNVQGLYIAQNPTTSQKNGGYVQFVPVSYNPYGGNTCTDNWGNTVQQPVASGGAPTFGLNDLIMWNSLSPSMPFGSSGSGLVQNVVATSPPTTVAGPCGIPLAVNTDYGINTNGYFFGRGGLATDLPFYNSIQSLQGGMTANSYTAGVLYPAGTKTTTGTLSVATYLGGHVDIGHSTTAPAAGTIATVTNPFSGGEGLVQGMIYYDDTLGCLRVYSGTTWSCSSGPANFTSLTVASGGSDITGNAVFHTGINVSGGSIVQSGAGSIAISGAGSFTTTTGGITTGSGSYGLSGAGVLTAVSATLSGITTNSGGTLVCVTNAGLLYKATMGVC